MNERAKEIFLFPENIPEVEALFDHLSTDQLPRKFRETSSNRDGFTKIVNAASFENLDKYCNVAAWKRKKGHRVINLIITYLS